MTERGAPDQEIRLVDCDVHPTFRQGVEDLAAFLSESWKARFGLTGIGGATQGRSWSLTLPHTPFYRPMPGGLRRDAVPPSGGRPASDPAYATAHHLDANGVDRALLLGHDVLMLGAFVHPDYASAYASAYNDWLEATWLDHDARYRGTIAVASQDPQRAAEEIRRCAARSDRWAGVLLSLGRSMMGDLLYHPIYEAAVECGLVVCVHLAGTEGTFQSAPALAGGIPATYFESKSTVTTVYQANLASLVIRGAFERFPDLRVAFIECGIGWVPDLLWRMDANWRALRDEAPWLRRPPSEYVYESVRFGSQPFVEPPSQQQLRAFCEMLRVDDTLIFASDYPHYDFDDPKRTLAQFPREARRAVAAENALTFFGERMASRAEVATR
jgi:predicted TIM-barrel fold metal-dependent hydrolase